MHPTELDPLDEETKAWPMIVRPQFRLGQSVQHSRWLKTCQHWEISGEDFTVKNLTHF